MSANQEAKKVVVEEIKAKIQNAKSVVLVSAVGLTVAQDTELRREFRKAGVEFKVLKNTLIRRAFNDLGVNDFDADLNGPTTVAFGTDEVSAAKIVMEAVKKCADIAHIQVDIGQAKEKNKYQELYDIYELSQKFYQNNINTELGKKAKEYLKNRQLDESIIKEFGIGLSLNEKDMLTKLLKSKKYDDKTLIRRYGVQSIEVAEAMAEGLYKVTNANICVGVTGFTCADVKEETDGLFYFSIKYTFDDYEFTFLEKYQVDGTRDEIRYKQTDYIFSSIIQSLNKFIELKKINVDSVKYK